MKNNSFLENCLICPYLKKYCTTFHFLATCLVTQRLDATGVHGVNTSKKSVDISAMNVIIKINTESSKKVHNVRFLMMQKNNAMIHPGHCSHFT